MTRRMLLSSLVAFVATGQSARAAEPPVFQIATGTLHATDGEAQKGYFSVNRGVMVAVTQDSPAHSRLKELLDHDCDLLIRDLGRV